MRKLLPLLRFPLTLLRAAAPAPPRGPKPPELMTDSDWVRHRAPRRHRDEVLSDAAVAWLARLPDDFRPDLLAARYPRIANRMALLWRDPGLIEEYLDDLLVARRPNRQGFAPEVASDLQSLQVLNEHRLYGAGDQDDRAA
jgi:hypothetical protein